MSDNDRIFEANVQFLLSIILGEIVEQEIKDKAQARLDAILFNDNNNK